MARKKIFNPLLKSDIQIIEDGIFTADIPVSLSGGKTAGKYTNGQIIPATGKTVEEVFNDIFQETLFPTLTNPSLGSATINVPTTQEVGTTIPTLTLASAFNRGSINPQYTATSNFRSGLPNTHIFGGVSSFIESVISTSLILSKTISNYVVVAGANVFTQQVSYDAGVQPKNSIGGNFNTPLSAGNSNPVTQIINGQLPYFFGVSNTQPTANQALINSGTKVVADSNGTINVTFGATAQYLWFAIPQASADKTKWFVNALNNGNIGLLTDLFNSETILAINSPIALWFGVNYRIYISNFPTTTTGVMQLQN